MTTSNNDIDNEIVGTTDNYNDIDNVNDKYARSKKVEMIADDLLVKLNAQSESRPFLCKVAWKLSESKIWDNYETSRKGNNPMGLFIYLCKRDMG